MADIGLFGAGPGTAITHRPLPEVERRISTALAQEERRSSVASSTDAKRRRSSVATVSGRRPSVFQQALGVTDPEKLRRQSVVTPHDLDVIKEAKQVAGEAFASGGDARYYEPIDSYEGKHRWDPEAEWTEAEEKRVVRRLDRRICAYVCLMFFALQLDRWNISQALTDNFLSELGSCCLESSSLDTG